MMYYKVVLIALTMILLFLTVVGCKKPLVSISEISSINSVDSKIESIISKVDSIEDSSQPETTVDTKSATQWKVIELLFKSAYDEKSSPYIFPFSDVTMDVEFVGPSGIKMIFPSFWDGEQTWKVRFAPTEIGTWTYQTTSSYTKDSGLHNVKGRLEVAPYTGNLEIYKRGFVTARPNMRYFTYADETPFFYLGDTHWNMPDERFDDSEVPSIPSQFKFLVDKRINQGFTVYQSEPIGAKYNLANGFNESDLPGFQDLDRRFEYIAEKGLVHANSQFFIPYLLVSNIFAYPDEYLEQLSRYWVARYAAYPVMWTLGQEVDKDFLGNFTVENNPYKNVAKWMNQYDPYKHPMTGHMGYTALGSQYVSASSSSLKDIPGHNWFGAQWSPGKSSQMSFDVPKDFWNSEKISINYEGLYENLWTKDFGARAQGWQAYLNGMFGYGYGAIDIWLYNSTYEMDVPTIRDGETITIEDKKIKWYDSVNLPGGIQSGYMREFFEQMNWWELTPRFNDQKWHIPTGGIYCLATIESDAYVIYYYNKSLATGTLRNLKNEPYQSVWFNPRDNTYSSAVTFTPTNGNYVIGNKPDSLDWVLYVHKA